MSAHQTNFPFLSPLKEFQKKAAVAKKGGPNASGLCPLAVSIIYRYQNTDKPTVKMK